MPKRIEVYRNGGAIWLVVDDHEIPADWIEEVQVNIDCDDGQDTVTVVLRADVIFAHATDKPAFVEVNDGQTQEGSTQASRGQQLRVSSHA